MQYDNVYFNYKLSFYCFIKFLFIMRKITLLLSALMLSSAMIAQSFIPSWDLEKMQREKEREAVEFYQQYYDVNPNAVAIPEVPTDAMYDLLFQFPPYDDQGTYAVATDGDYIYTARWNEYLFHKLDFEGNLVEEFTITGAGEIRDLAYDGEYFYGAPNSTTIYIMDFVNKVLVGTISGPSAVRGMAYDEINDGFWVTNGWDPPIRLISRTGAVLQTLNTSASSFAGIGWENVTEGGPYLWGYCQSGAVNNLLVKIDVTSGATLETFELNQSVTFSADGIAGGMEITDKVYPGKWAFFGTSQNDCIWAVELADSAPADAPAAVTNLTATAGANGALTATLNWNNPAVSVIGEPLTDLTAVNIYRNDALIHTINNPVIGGAATYTDNAVPEAGNVVYKLVAENSAGEGIPASVTVWVGPDVPAAPGNVLLVAQGNDGFITWDAPDGGLHGGYYTPAGLNYTVKRFPGSVTVAENITVLEFLDNTVPGVGNYYYTVTAANDVGVGGTGTSNAALLGAEGLLIFEQFDSGMPAGWEVLGMGGGNWSVVSSANAGGTAPELQLSWSPSFVGVSRFASPNINSGEYSALRLKFNQMLNDFSTYTGEFIAVDYSIDNGATWEQIWYHEASSSLGPELTEVYFSVPENTNFRIAFKFDGDVYNINYWYIDNVVVEPVMGNDLSAIAVTGNVTPSVGDATNYTVKFQNSGADPVVGSAYTVKLYKEGGELLGTAQGVDIAPAEIKTVVIPWTPEEAGATYLYGYIDYPDDDIPGNNTTGHMNVVVQPEGIIAITIGEGTNMPTFRIPFDFYWRNSIAQTLYFADEIGIGGGVLTAIKYTNNFQTNLPAKEVKVLIGETNEPNLASNWIDPTGFTMVYDGVIDFPSGVNSIMIPLTTPYVYSGGNLVVITNRVYEGNYHSSNDKFYGTEFPGSSRNRYVQSDATIYDPWQVISGTTLSNWAPNSTLFFSAEGLGSLNGTVTAASGGEPIEGVLVKVLGTMAETETNAQGQYNFPALLAGTFDVEFSKYGWETFVGQATIVADETTTLNASLNSVALPEIQVTPAALNQVLPVGGQATQDLTISNLGELPLEWAAAVQMPTLSYFVFDVPEGKIEPFEIDVTRANAIPGGAPEASSTKDEVILNYDGENYDAIGLTAGGTFHVAVRFPSSMVGQYAGYHLNFVNIYINDVPSPGILKVWGAGTTTSPGALLHEQPLSVSADSWHLIELTEIVALDGSDIWVGYTVTHPEGQYPPGCDAGPHHPSGDGSWISTDGVSWDRLYELGLDYNWNIRAHIAPGTTPWVSINPKQGTVAGGESGTIVVTFDASEVDPGTYNGNIIIASNDPNNPGLTVPVTLQVGDIAILPGDSNGDGVVDIFDVIATINYLIGLNPDPFVFENADVNGDGVVDIFDVIATINIIIGNKSLAPVNSSDANIYLNSNNITLQSDGTIVGLQFELTGIENLNFALKGYQFASNVVNGKLIGVIFSLDNTPLPAGDITLFTFNETSGLKWGQVIGGNVNAGNVQINKFQGSEFQLAVFPNPAKEVLNVNSNETINFIRLSNQIGQMVEESVIDASNYTINTSNMSKGIYILEVHTQNNVSVQKIVIE